MKITKLGHCALVLEIHPSTNSGQAGVRILTDPGSFTIEAQEEQKNVDAVLITHEHQDHIHMDSVKKIIANCPGAVVVTNGAVGKLLAAQGIAHTQVGDGESTEVKGVLIEGFGKDHALVYPPNLGLVENTGYFVAPVKGVPHGAGNFYFPGDNFHLPAQAGNPRKVDVLALPVAGPWMKTAEAIDFAKLIKARTAFGVHDGMIVPSFRSYVGMLLEKFVPETEYISLADGETREF